MTEILARNPCTIRGASVDRSTLRPEVSAEAVWALAEAVPPIYRTVVWVPAGTALRSAEFGGLHRRDVDLDARILTVPRAYVERARGEAYFGPPRSDAGTRRVVIPGVIIEVLREHMGLYSEPGPDGLVFVSDKGEPFSRHSRKWWRRLTRPAARRSAPVLTCPERARVAWIGHVAGTRPLSAILERGLVAGRTSSDLQLYGVELRGLEPLTPTLPA
jgi:integrase